MHSRMRSSSHFFNSFDLNYNLFIIVGLINSLITLHSCQSISGACEKSMGKTVIDVAEYRCPHVIYFVNSLIHGRGFNDLTNF